MIFCRMMEKATEIVAYKYEKRLEVLLTQVAECCGSRNDGKVCSDCKLRIAKCSRLLAKSQIPLPYYIKLVRSIMAGSIRSE